jgi:hypothetical protein
MVLQKKDDQHYDEGLTRPLGININSREELIRQSLLSIPESETFALARYVNMSRASAVGVPLLNRDKNWRLLNRFRNEELLSEAHNQINDQPGVAVIDVAGQVVHGDDNEELAGFLRGFDTGLNIVYFAGNVLWGEIHQSSRTGESFGVFLYNPLNARTIRGLHQKLAKENLTLADIVLLTNSDMTALKQFLPQRIFILPEPDFKDPLLLAHQQCEGTLIIEREEFDNNMGNIRHLFECNPKQIVQANMFAYIE